MPCAVSAPTAMDGLGLAAPGEFCLDGNLAENWKKWRGNFENYLVAINLVTQPCQENGDWPAANAAIWLRQIAILRHCIGEEAVEILDQVLLTYLKMVIAYQMSYVSLKAISIQGGICCMNGMSSCL